MCHRARATAAFGAMPMEVAGVAGHSAKAPVATLLEYLESTDCTLSSIVVTSSDYSRAVATHSNAFREAHEEWILPTGYVQLQILRRPFGKTYCWEVCWTDEALFSEELVAQLVLLLPQHRTVEVVWITAVKAEAAEEGEKHEENILRKLSRPVHEVIDLDNYVVNDDHDDDRITGSMLESSLLEPSRTVSGLSLGRFLSNFGMLFDLSSAYAGPHAKTRLAKHC